ncbi:MAG TPA: hypothetical protein VMV46_13545, partial [Thermoanaerobaculia bacterium]|nr:hypothetical protein [Thermoanaerobaculia bacterium]
ISRLLRHCLERNPRNRLHDIADARIVIVEVVAGKDDEQAPSGIVVDPGVGASAGRWRLAAGAGLLAGLPLGLAGAALWLALPSGETPAPALTQSEIRAPESTGLVSGLAISPDGRGATGQGELWLRDLDGEGDEVRLTEENTGEFNGEVSPDGAWVAFASDVTRNWEVYIRRLDGVGGAIRISSGGGSQPLLRRDGRELYYLDTLGRLVAVPITAGEPLRPGAPETLFAARLEEATDRQYDVAADGRRFLLNRSLTSDTAPLVVVLDWTALLDPGAR